MIEEQKIQQLINMLEQGIQKAADTLGVAVPQLWEILIRQQYVEAANSILALLAILTVAGIYAWVAKKLLKSDSSYEETYGGEDIKDIVFFSLVISGIFIAVILLITTIGFFENETIGKILNPEYYALKDIAEFIKR